MVTIVQRLGQRFVVPLIWVRFPVVTHRMLLPVSRRVLSAKILSPLACACDIDGKVKYFLFHSVI